VQRSLIIVACGALHQLRPACFVEPRTCGCTKSSRDRRLGTIGAKGTLAQQEREFGASRCAHATVRRCLPSVACCASLAFSLTAAVRRRRGVSAGDPGPERRLPVLCARMSSRRRGLSRARLQHDALGWAGPSAADGSLSAPIEEAKKRSARLCGYRGPRAKDRFWCCCPMRLGAPMARGSASILADPPPRRQQQVHSTPSRPAGPSPSPEGRRCLSRNLSRLCLVS
jgi:hypothetical protein